MEGIRGGAETAVVDPAGQDRMRRAGAQFEAVLLNSVLEGMERAFTELPGGQKHQSTQAYSGLAIQTLSSELAEQGGIGIGKLVAEALSRRAREGENKVTERVKDF